MIEVAAYQNQFNGVGVVAFGKASGEVSALQVADLSGNLINDFVDANGLLQDAQDIGIQRVLRVRPVELLALVLSVCDHACLHQPAQFLPDGIIAALPEIALHFTQMTLGVAVQKQLHQKFNTGF